MSPGSLVLGEPGRLGAGPHDTLWLEYREPGRFRLLVEKGPAAPADGEVTTEQGIPILLDPQDENRVHTAGVRPANLMEFDLALRAARLRSHAGFDRLICLPLVRDMDLYEHQVRPQVEAGNEGKVVGIDVDTGDFELAADRLLARHPEAHVWFVCIGQPGVHRFGPRVLARRP